MLVSEFITRLNYALRGIDDDAPMFDSDEANYWLDTLNRKKNELYEDVTQLWRNTFEVRSLGVVTTSLAPAYDIDEDFLGASDLVYVITTDDQRREYTIVQPQERQLYWREAYIAGMNPQKLYFTNAIAADESIIGGELFLPGYYMPADVTEEDDTLPFLDPNWAVMAVAAEIAGNDIVYEDKEANLTSKANNLYRLMVKKNKRGTYRNPRTASIAVDRIRSAR